MSKYTPELADLMEHEKVIEQAITSAWRDVAWSLEKIRDGRKYRAAGFDNFETYCRDRWNIGRNYANKMIRAASAELGTAVPTEREARRILAKRNHPAPFSDPILSVIDSHLDGAEVVLDPFAGTGRVHELATADRRTIGVEIEPEWASRHPNTIVGNALDLSEVVEAESVDAIATSPTYGNRMADHHDARDGSVRVTYKHTLGRDLAADNSGAMQWGEEYRSFHRAAWAESIRVLRRGGTLTLNIKNHIRGGVEQRVAEWHIDTLYSLGLHLVALNAVRTTGTDAGTNADQRVGYELIATFRK